MVFEAIPFPFDAIVFMLPKGTVRHPTKGDCPLLVFSRTRKGQALSLPIRGLDFSVTAEQDAVLVTTYMPQAEFNVRGDRQNLVSPRIEGLRQPADVASFAADAFKTTALDHVKKSSGKYVRLTNAPKLKFIESVHSVRAT